METVTTEQMMTPEGFCHVPPEFSRENVVAYLTEKRDRYRQWRDQAVARKAWGMATHFRQGCVTLDTVLQDISDMRT